MQDFFHTQGYQEFVRLLGDTLIYYYNDGLTGISCK